MATRILSKVINSQVFTNCGDIVVSLYDDLDNISDEKVRQYIRDSIQMWKEYQEDILRKAGK